MTKKERKFNYFLASLFVRNFSIPAADEAIDVIIPVIEKDLNVLPLCLEGVRRCVNHPIGTIHIVAPNSPAIVNFCAEHNCTFVHEDSVFGWGVKSIDYRVGEENRAGWIFQQLLKLAGTISTTPYYLVIDADHVLIRPHTFLDKAHRTVFYQSKEFHPPYYKNMAQLLGITHQPRLSYVAHKMLFSVERLHELQEKWGGEGKWVQTILNSLDPNELSCFSEYETYGCFMPASAQRTKPWRNKNLTYGQMADYDTLTARYARKYLAVTFPEYKNSK